MKNLYAPCSTGKAKYYSEEEAEESLVGLWVRHQYREGAGPQSFYCCIDCGDYHLTKQGPMNPRLRKGLDDGSIAAMRRHDEWEDRFR